MDALSENVELYETWSTNSWQRMYPIGLRALNDIKLSLQSTETLSSDIVLDSRHDKNSWVWGALHVALAVAITNSGSDTGPRCG